MPIYLIDFGAFSGLGESAINALAKSQYGRPGFSTAGHTRLCLPAVRRCGSTLSKILFYARIYARDSSVRVKISVQPKSSVHDSKDERSSQIKMQRQDVSSSRIKSIGYNHEQKVLEIEFFGLGIYQYVGVPAKTYETFLTVRSKGRFFDGVIKNKFLCRKIG